MKDRQRHFQFCSSTNLHHLHVRIHLAALSSSTYLETNPGPCLTRELKYFCRYFSHRRKAELPNGHILVLHSLAVIGPTFLQLQQKHHQYFHERNPQSRFCLDQRFLPPVTIHGSADLNFSTVR